MGMNGMRTDEMKNTEKKRCDNIQKKQLMRQIEKSNFNAIYSVVMTKAASLNFPLIKTFESERQWNRERTQNFVRCTLDKPTKDKCTPHTHKHTHTNTHPQIIWEIFWTCFSLSVYVCNIYMREQGRKEERRKETKRERKKKNERQEQRETKRAKESNRREKRAEILFFFSSSSFCSSKQHTTCCHFYLI